MTQKLTYCAVHDDMGIPKLPISYDTARFIGSMYIFGYGKDLDLLVLLPEGAALVEHFDDLREAGVGSAA